MRIFDILIEKVKHKHSTKTIDKIKNIHNIISINNQIDEINLDDTERKILEFISFVKFTEEKEIKAILFFILACFYLKKIKQKQIRLFMRIVNPNDYDNYLRALHCYNLCLCISENFIDKNDFKNHKDEFYYELFYLFLSNYGSTNSINNIFTELQNLKLDLDDRRNEISDKKIDTIEKYKNTTKFYLKYIKNLVSLSVDLVAKNIVEIPYAILGIGSLSRREVTPYSDLEFIILIENNEKYNEKIQILNNAMQLMHLMVITLRETLVPDDLFSDKDIINEIKLVKTNRGFSFDVSGRTPLGKRYSSGGNTYYKFELLGDIGHVFKYMSQKKYLNDYKAQSEFSQFITIKKSNEQYCNLIENYQNSLVRFMIEDKDMLANLILDNQVTVPFKKWKTYSNNPYVKEIKDDYSNALSFLSKHQIYRPLERYIDSMWLIFSLDKKFQNNNSADLFSFKDEHFEGLCKSSIDKINELSSKKLIDENFSEIIKSYFIKALNLRLAIYSEYKLQREDIIISSSYFRDNNSPAYLLVKNNLISEVEMGQIIAFTYDCYANLKLYITDKRNANDNIKFGKDIINSNNFIDMANNHYNNNKIPDALKCYKYHMKLLYSKDSILALKIIKCYLIDNKFIKAKKYIETKYRNFLNEKEYFLYKAICLYGLIKKNDSSISDIELKDSITTALDLHLKHYNIYINIEQTDGIRIDKNITNTDFILCIFLYAKLFRSNNQISNWQRIAFRLFKNLSPEEIENDLANFLKLILNGNTNDKNAKDKYGEMIDSTLDRKYISTIFNNNSLTANENTKPSDSGFIIRSYEKNIFNNYLKQHHICCLYGSSALGKTTFVRKIIEDYYIKSHEIIWLNASNKIILSSTYAAVSFQGDYIDVAVSTSIDDITKKVYEAIQSRSKEKPVFIIYDNVKNFNTIKEYLPFHEPLYGSGNPLNKYVIISSKHLHQKFPSLHINKLPDESSLQIKEARGIPLCYRLLNGKKPVSLSINDEPLDKKFIDKVINSSYMNLSDEQRLLIEKLSFLNTEFIPDDISNILGTKNNTLKDLINLKFIEEHVLGDGKYYTIHSRIKKVLHRNFSEDGKIISLLKDIYENLFKYYRDIRGDLIHELYIIPHLSSFINFIKPKLNNFSNNIEIIEIYSVMTSILHMLSHGIYGCDKKDTEYLEKALYYIEKKFFNIELKGDVKKADIETEIRKIRLLLRTIGYAHYDLGQPHLAKVYIHEALMVTKLILKNETIPDKNNSKLFREAIAYRDLANILEYTGSNKSAINYANHSLTIFESDFNKRKDAAYRIHIAIAQAIAGMSYYGLGEYEKAETCLMKGYKKKLKLFTGKKKS